MSKKNSLANQATMALAALLAISPICGDAFAFEREYGGKRGGRAPDSSEPQTARSAPPARQAQSAPEPPQPRQVPFEGGRNRSDDSNRSAPPSPQTSPSEQRHFGGANTDRPRYDRGNRDSNSRPGAGYTPPSAPPQPSAPVTDSRRRDEDHQTRPDRTWGRDTNRTEDRDRSRNENDNRTWNRGSEFSQGRDRHDNDRNSHNRRDHDNDQGRERDRDRDDHYSGNRDHDNSRGHYYNNRRSHWDHNSWGSYHPRVDHRRSHHFRNYSGVRIGFYFAPYYGYYSVPSSYYGHSYRRGDYLPTFFLSYRLNDPYEYGLPYPPYDCAYVWVGSSIVLVDLYNYEILEIYYNVY